MPVSKNRRKKPKVATSAKPAKANKVAALPDRRAMEGFMASLGGRRGGDPVAAAQDVMYDAWELSNRRKRIALARRALAISPLCSDAYVLLAEETAKSVREALVYYQKGVEAGELALGPEGFEKCAGRFWGHLETRPYMRARAGLAAALWALGRRQEAIEHYRAMLELNPNDNQGIRYLLAAQLLAQNDIEALKSSSSSTKETAVRSGCTRKPFSPSARMIPTPMNWLSRLGSRTTMCRLCSQITSPRSLLRMTTSSWAARVKQHTT